MRQKPFGNSGSKLCVLLGKADKQSGLVPCLIVARHSALCGSFRVNLCSFPLTDDDSDLTCWVLQTLPALARSTKPCQARPWKPLCSASSTCGMRGDNKTMRSSQTPTLLCLLSWRHVMPCCMAWAPSTPPSAPPSSSRSPPPPPPHPPGHRLPPPPSLILQVTSFPLPPPSSSRSPPSPPLILQVNPLPPLPYLPGPPPPPLFLSLILQVKPLPPLPSSSRSPSSPPPPPSFSRCPFCSAPCT